MPHSITYYFRQRFCVPPFKAYRWCTDYDPQDNALMHENAKREILRITETTLVLTDVYDDKNGSIKKQKLVHLYPNRLTWTSTHLTGPNKYSQFLYEIVPEGKRASCLDFTGLHIEYNNEEKFDKEGIKLLASKLRKEDSAAWKLLAKEMEREFREKLI